MERVRRSNITEVATSDILSVPKIINAIVRQPIHCAKAYAFEVQDCGHAFVCYKKSPNLVFVTEQNYGSEGILLDKIISGLRKKNIIAVYKETSLADYPLEKRIKDYACNLYAGWARRNLDRWLSQEDLNLKNQE